VGKQSGAYSESKMVWWAYREGFPPDSPKQIHWILSDLCNQDCHFCAYRMEGYTSNELFGSGSKSELSAYGHDNPVRWIDTDRALRLIDEFKAAGCLSLQFTGGGEPTVHPRHEDIFQKALDTGFQCALVSNGYRWRERIFDILPKFKWIRVSVDAGTPENYAAIRRVKASAWDTVWGNIHRLVESCKGLAEKPYIGLGYVVTPQSYKEIYKFSEIAQQAGVDNIRFTALFSTENEIPLLPIYEETCDLIRQSRESFKSVAIHDNFGTRLADLVQREPDYSFCSYQYYTTYVGGDVNVYRCCVLAYNKRGLIPGGDIKNRRFDEFWASDERKQNFREFDAKGCPRCQFNQKNRELLYVTGSTYSGPATHVEFP